MGITKPRPGGGCLDAGLRLLARRPHAEAELRLKLGHRGYPADDVEEAMGRLRELGYIDDGAFARGLTARRSPLRGRRGIAAELAARGVGRDVAAAALADVDDAAEADAAYQLAVRLSARGRYTDGAAGIAALAGRLQRRGFSAAAVRSACRRLAATLIESPAAAGAG